MVRFDTAGHLPVKFRVDFHTENSDSADDTAQTLKNMYKVKSQGMKAVCRASGLSCVGLCS